MVFAPSSLILTNNFLPLNEALYGKKIMSNFEGLNLHDATLINIEFEWNTALALVTLKLHDQNVVIKFSECTDVSIPQTSPWGESISVNVTCKVGDSFKIEMQSGDVISIKARSFCIV